MTGASGKWQINLTNPITSGVFYRQLPITIHLEELTNE
jgi:hypothetical protein